MGLYLDAEKSSGWLEGNILKSCSWKESEGKSRWLPLFFIGKIETGSFKRDIVCAMPHEWKSLIPE